MQTVVLVGGLGTRLRPLLPNVPKAMAPVGDKPFLAYQVEHLAAQGFNDLVLCVGYRAEQIRDHFGDGRSLGVRINYAIEDRLLGTAGAIRNARLFIRGACLVCNGDSYLDMDFRALVQAHKQHYETNPGTVGTIAVLQQPNAISYGALTLNAANQILAFQEKRATGPAWVNGGAYVLEPAVMDAIPSDRVVSLEHDIFPAMLASGSMLFGFPVHGYFVDIGTPEGYHQFCAYALGPRA